MKHSSPNGEYELYVSSGYIEDGQRVEDGLQLFKHGALQFEKDLIGSIRIMFCHDKHGTHSHPRAARPSVD